jgi:DNA-binding response OmpR family regulator
MTWRPNSLCSDANRNALRRSTRKSAVTTPEQRLQTPSNKTTGPLLPLTQLTLSATHRLTRRSQIGNGLDTRFPYRRDMENPWQPLLDRAARLGDAERAVLRVLIEAEGKVVNRAELAQRSGLDNLSARRVDSALVNIRRAVGPEQVVTVRGRGWRAIPEPAPANVS